MWTSGGRQGSCYERIMRCLNSQIVQCQYTSGRPPLALATGLAQTGVVEGREWRPDIMTDSSRVGDWGSSRCIAAPYQHLTEYQSNLWSYVTVTGCHYWLLAAPLLNYQPTQPPEVGRKVHRRWWSDHRSRVGGDSGDSLGLPSDRN